MLQNEATADRLQWGGGAALVWLAARHFSSKYEQDTKPITLRHYRQAWDKHENSTNGGKVLRVVEAPRATEARREGGGVMDHPGQAFR